jgi:hypothetical protein
MRTPRLADSNRNASLVFFGVILFDDEPDVNRLNSRAAPSDIPSFFCMQIASAHAAGIGFCAHERQDRQTRWANPPPDSCAAYIIIGGHLMENAAPIQPDEGKPIKKRPGMERVVVWIGIILLLGVVILEWQVRDQYETSYKNIETVINTRDETGKYQGLPVADVDKYIKGMPFRTDRVDEERTQPARGEPVVMKKHRLIFKWPSLFKHYEFRLSFGSDDKINQIEAVIPGVNN